MFKSIKNRTTCYMLHATKSKGFSLIEMLVVITIIGLLAGVVMVSTNSARIAGRDTKRKADLEASAAALELYYSQNKEYPIYSSWTKFDDLESILNSYIGTWPADPKSQTGGDCLGYCYISNDNGAKYLLDVILEKNEGSGTCSSQTDLTFYESTTCVYSGKSHYRVAGK